MIAFTFGTILHVVLWIVFFLSALFLGILVLLQESKGGGLAEAFGGIGAETFGTKTGGVNKVTFTVATVFLVAAILIHATWNL